LANGIIPTLQAPATAKSTTKPTTKKEEEKEGF